MRHQIQSNYNPQYKVGWTLGKTPRAEAMTVAQDRVFREGIHTAMSRRDRWLMSYGQKALDSQNTRMAVCIMISGT